MFGTLQDRLVKELRLAGMSTIAAAYSWRPGFMAEYNKRFAHAPTNAKDLLRPLTKTDDLDEIILAWREQRTVTNNLTLYFDRMMIMLTPTPETLPLRRRKVEVVSYPDGPVRGSVRGGAAALHGL